MSTKKKVRKAKKESVTIDFKLPQERHIGDYFIFEEAFQVPTKVSAHKDDEDNTTLRFEYLSCTVVEIIDDGNGISLKENNLIGHPVDLRLSYSTIADLFYAMRILQHTGVSILNPDVAIIKGEEVT